MNYIILLMILIVTLYGLLVIFLKDFCYKYVVYNLVFMNLCFGLLKCFSNVFIGTKSIVEAYAFMKLSIF